jgi:hypothetical protein
MWRQSYVRPLLWRIVAGLLIDTTYAGARYGSPVSGGLAGALLAASLFSLERLVLRRNAGGLIRPLPFLAYFALRSVLYVVAIVFVIAVRQCGGGGWLCKSPGLRPHRFVGVGGWRHPLPQR